MCNHNWAVVTSNSGEHLKYCTLCGAEEYEQCQFVKTVVSPTCENEGYTEYSCICGYSYKTDYTSPLGHQYMYISNNNGTHHRVCIECRLQQEDENCVEINSDDENKCKYCNYIFQTKPSSENTTQTTTQQATTEPCRHDMVLYKENTQHYYKCSKCGFVEYEKHTYAVMNMLVIQMPSVIHIQAALKLLLQQQVRMVIKLLHTVVQDAVVRRYKHRP